MYVQHMKLISARHIKITLFYLKNCVLKCYEKRSKKGHQTQGRDTLFHYLYLMEKIVWRERVVEIKSVVLALFWGGGNIFFFKLCLYRFIKLCLHMLYIV